MGGIGASILPNRQLQNVEEKLGRCMQKLIISDFDYRDTDYYWRCNALFKHCISWRRKNATELR
jgi:hypothetical protein